MATSTRSNRTLGLAPAPARIANDGIPSGGPFPTMSARAGLIARAVTVTLLFALLAASGSQLVAVLALAIPFWIAIEIEVRHSRQVARTPLFRSSVITLPCIGRLSNPPTDHPRAA